jgi:hypothetical protein
MPAFGSGGIHGDRGSVAGFQMFPIGDFGVLWSTYSRNVPDRVLSIPFAQLIPKMYPSGNIYS